MKSANMSSFLRYLGIATASYAVMRAASFLYKYSRRSAISRCLRHDRDSWALITGASDGIGLGFAQELAQRGFNVILHGRNKQKLENVTQQLVKDFPQVQTRIFVVDASSPETTSFRDLQDMIRDLHVTILINNVGGDLGRDKAFSYLQDFDLENIDRLMSLNAGFATKVTSTLIPTLIKNQPSVILNISSYCCLGFPMASIYSGSKAYINSISESLQGDFLKSGNDITVHAVLSGAVETELSGMKRSFFCPTPRDWAKATLGRVGRASMEMTGYWPHALEASVLTVLSEGLRRRLLVRVMSEREHIFEKMQ